MFAQILKTANPMVNGRGAGPFRRPQIAGVGVRHEVFVLHFGLGPLVMEIVHFERQA
jgi:hypothetical protein